MLVGSTPVTPMVRSYAPASVAVAPAAAPAPSAPAPAASAQASEAMQAFSEQFGAFTMKAKSFLSNIWDTVLGPALNSLFSMIKGAFGG